MTRKEITEAYSLFEAAINGDLRARAEVLESLTTSDFPILLGQGFHTKLLAAYQAIDPVWSGYSTRAVVSNFKKQKLKQILGGTGLKPVTAGGEYEASSLDESEYDFSVGKFGRRIGLTWEMLINDELGAFRNIDQVLAVAARDLEAEETAAALLNAAQSDVNTQFFKASNGNAPESAALTRAALKDALQALSLKKAPGQDKKLLRRPPLVLVVPPTLDTAAQEVLEASEIRRTVGDETIITRNPVAGAVSLVVEPLLLQNSNSKAASTWYLLPAPNTARPALVTGFLAGHESPDLRVKNDQGTRVGGGSIPANEGSFDDDTVQYRVRHVVGAAAIDPTFTFVSRGA